MTYNKRKKNSRARGSWTHFWGEKKKHRGAGSRGGKGNAGSGKRGDAKKPTYVNAGRKWGKHGFTNATTKSVSSINVAFFTQANLEGKKGVTIAKDAIKIDLAQLGYNKLLGTGKVTGKFEITVDVATPSAVKKIEAAGGKVVTLAPQQESSESAEE